MPRSLGHLQSDLKYALTTAGDLIWPKRSILSGEPSRGSLTPEDFKSLSFITGSICRQCGVPQDLDLGETAICAACHARKPAWSRARAALIYDDVSRKPVLALKRGGQRAGLELMANWMSIAGADLIEDADIILPVPLHYSRLISRGYNQSGWLAAAVSRRTGKPLRHAALKRIK
ncbi:MAG: ComF family protein, partial [Pseudomonadota bacterium]